MDPLLRELTRVAANGTDLSSPEPWWTAPSPTRETRMSEQRRLTTELRLAQAEADDLTEARRRMHAGLRLVLRPW